MKIGIFDSGIGGLTVLKELRDALPEADYIYYADTCNVPYGTKTPEQVYGYVERVVQFMMTKNIDALVIACNTATSIAVKRLRASYNIPIIGMEPAIKPALSLDDSKKVIVFATELTLKEEKFNQLVQNIGGEDRVIPIPAPGLVEFAEKTIVTGSDVTEYINELLKNVAFAEVGALVLGCTHFIYFRKALKELLPPSIKLMDGNRGTVLQVLRKLEDTHHQGMGDIEFYYNDTLDEDHTILNKYLSLL